MEKKTSLFENGLIWFGAGVSIAEILTGTYFAPLGIWQRVNGCNFTWSPDRMDFMMFVAGMIGGTDRKSAMETVKDEFRQSR